MEEIFREHNEGTANSYDDILSGSAYLDAVEDGRIKDCDTVLMLSMDGAQLLRNKKSDCWIYLDSTGPRTRPTLQDTQHYSWRRYSRSREA